MPVIQEIFFHSFNSTLEKCILTLVIRYTLIIKKQLYLKEFVFRSALTFKVVPILLYQIGSRWHFKMGIFKISEFSFNA